jgi:hypothetical protein
MCLHCVASRNPVASRARRGVAAANTALIYDRFAVWNACDARHTKRKEERWKFKNEPKQSAHLVLSPPHTAHEG